MREGRSEVKDGGWMDDVVKREKKGRSEWSIVNKEEK